jgi:hypothetical protein
MIRTCRVQYQLVSLEVSFLLSVPQGFGTIELCGREGFGNHLQL